MTRLRPRPGAPRSTLDGSRGLVALIALVLGTAAPACDAPAGPEEDSDSPALAGDLDAGSAESAESAESCVPETYALSDSMSVHGCATQIDALVRADVPPPDVAPSDSLSAGVPDPLEATNGRRLKECSWGSYVDTQQTMMILCPDDKHVVAGGCYGQARLLNSAPVEAQTAGNLPEDNERVQDVTALSGWMCSYDAPTGSAGQNAAVLCCR